MLKRFSWLATALLAATVATPMRAEIIEQVLVKVNGEIVTLSDFEQRQVAALQQRPELATLPPDSPQFALAVAESAPLLILDAVDELLWLQRAKEQGWGLTDTRYAEILNDIRTSNNLQDDAAFKAALAAEGMTESQLRESIERNMLVTQVQRQEVLEKIDVTEGEILEYYEIHRSEFTTPSEVTLREILIPVPSTERGVNVALDEAARAAAEEARTRLLAGEPFPRLAGELSSAPSKSNGGLIDGSIQLDQMAPIYQEMLSAMEVGEITPVIATTSGYHILKLETRSETQVQSLAEARDAVARRVAEQKSEGEMWKYLERLRAQATITWRHDELKKAYEQALAERRSRAGLT
jgi:peptidyl-prolyl cis-trans isomerase SurA